MHDWTGTEKVIDKERLRELSERSNGPATLYLLSHAGAIALTTTGLYYTAGTWWCVPFFLLQGLLFWKRFRSRSSRPPVSPFSTGFERHANLCW